MWYVYNSLYQVFTLTVSSTSMEVWNEEVYSRDSLQSLAGHVNVMLHNSLFLLQTHYSACSRFQARDFIWNHWIKEWHLGIREPILREPKCSVLCFLFRKKRVPIMQ